MCTNTESIISLPRYLGGWGKRIASSLRQDWVTKRSYVKNQNFIRAEVAHTFNLRKADLCEFKASLVYRASSVTQRNPVSENTINLPALGEMDIV